MIYQTKYSQINDLSKKERKLKQTQFPWFATNSNLSNSEWIGQIVTKEDKGTSVKFCPLCDQPMIVRMMIYPCEHCICFKCSKPDSDNCYVCDGKITNIIRIPDKAKLYDCDYPDCFKFFENNEKIGMHKYSIHNLQVDPSIIMKYNLMMHSMGSIQQSNYSNTQMVMSNPNINTAAGNIINQSSGLLNQMQTSNMINQIQNTNINSFTQGDAMQ